MPISSRWPFLEKSLFLDVIKCHTRLCACNLKNLRHTKNSLFTNLLQGNTLSRVDSPYQTPNLVLWCVHAAPKSPAQFRFCVRVPS